MILKSTSPLQRTSPTGSTCRSPIDRSSFAEQKITLNESKIGQIKEEGSSETLLKECNQQQQDNNGNDKSADRNRGTTRGERANPKASERRSTIINKVNELDITEAKENMNNANDKKTIDTRRRTSEKPSNDRKNSSRSDGIVNNSETAKLTNGNEEKNNSNRTDKANNNRNSSSIDNSKDNNSVSTGKNLSNKGPTIDAEQRNRVLMEDNGVTARVTLNEVVRNGSSNKTVAKSTTATANSQKKDEPSTGDNKVVASRPVVSNNNKTQPRVNNRPAYSSVSRSKTIVQPPQASAIVSSEPPKMNRIVRSKTTLEGRPASNVNKTKSESMFRRRSQPLSNSDKV